MLFRLRVLDGISTAVYCLGVYCVHDCFPAGGIGAEVDALFQMSRAIRITKFEMHPGGITRRPGPMPVPCPILHRFLTGCSSLKWVQLNDFTDMNEDVMNALHEEGNSNLAIELLGCTFTSGGQQSFVEHLQNNPGPTMLGADQSDLRTLAQFLAGNTRLSLQPLFFAGNTHLRYLHVVLNNLPGDAGEFGALMRALGKNNGLKSLTVSFLQDVPFSDEDWSSMCHSLTKHPSLESLSIQFMFQVEATEPTKTFRVQRLLEMLKGNLVIWNISVITNLFAQVDWQLFTMEIKPRLEINRHRHILQDVKETPIASRKAAAVEAMSTLNYENTSLRWMLVLDNADVLFYSLP